MTVVRAEVSDRLWPVVTKSGSCKGREEEIEGETNKGVGDIVLYLSAGEAMVTQGSFGIETTFEKVREAPRVLIATTVLNMLSKKSANRLPGCSGSLAGAQVVSQ